MEHRIVSWGDREDCVSPALSSADSMVSFDSTFSETHSHLQMPPTASETPRLHNADLGAMLTSLPGFSEGRKTLRGEHATPDDSFIRHDEYFFKDGNVTFLVGGTLYCVHRFFFARDSIYFSTRFAKLGIRDHEALPTIISIGDVECKDFEALLSVLYPASFEARELPYEQWKSVLHLSTRWGFASLRRLALKSIKPPTSHDQLVLARTYLVEYWVLPALTALCSRTLPLSLDEARQMSIEDVILVATVREEIRDGALRVDVADIPRHIANAEAEAEAEAKLKAEMKEKGFPEANDEDSTASKAKLDAEAPAKAESEARANHEAAKVEREAKARAEYEAKARAEYEAKAQAEYEAKAQAEYEAKTRAEREAKAQAKCEAKVRAESEAQARAESEAKARAECEAKARAAYETKTRAEDKAVEYEAKARAAYEAKARAEDRAVEYKAKALAEYEAKIRAERKAKARAETLGKAEAAAREKWEADVSANAEADADEARLKAAETEMTKAELEAKQNAEKERLEIEAESKAKAAKAEEEERVEMERDKTHAEEQIARQKAMDRAVRAAATSSASGPTSLAWSSGSWFDMITRAVPSVTIPAEEPALHPKSTILPDSDMLSNGKNASSPSTEFGPLPSDGGRGAPRHSSTPRPTSHEPASIHPVESNMVTPSSANVVPSLFTIVSEGRKVINDERDGDTSDGKDYQAQNSTETTAALPAEAPSQLGHSSLAGDGVNTTSTTSMSSLGSPPDEAPAETLEDWSQCTLTKAQKKRLRMKMIKRQAQKGEEDKPRPPPSHSGDNKGDNSVAQEPKPAADSFPCRCSVCWRRSMLA